MSIFDELYNPLYAPLPDAEKYLERIGVQGFEKPDKATLDALILAHLRTVPFENLDVFDADIGTSLNIESLFEKIVLNRRGGYCFELNAAFTALLESLGYECCPVAVRVVWNATRHMPLSHRAAIVTIDGVRYFADVGFGGPSPQGTLLMDEPGEQPSGSNIFVIERGGEHGTVTYRLVDGKKEKLLMFREDRCDPIDFLALNTHLSKSHYSMFRKGRLINLVTPTGNKTLSGNVLTINTTGGEPVQQTLETEAEVRSALKEHFGLDVDMPLKMD